MAAHVEAGALMRRAEAEGGFATILQRGDPERGTLLLIILGRGQYFACLERLMAISGDYHWTVTGPQESAELAEIQEFMAKKQRFDPDLWCIELDIAQPERFVAEMTELS